MKALESTMEFAWFIITGAVATIELTVLGCAVVLVVACVAGIGLLAPQWWVRGLARIYVEIFRGTSLFVQLFAIYFLLPLSGITLSPLQAGVLAIGLNGGAYGAEVVRSGIQAVGSDQREACVAVNLTEWQAMRWIIFPQAMIVMLPSFGNLAIEVMKATAVTSLISVSELTFQAQTVRSQTGETAMPFLVIFATYLLIASVLIWIVRLLEKRFGRGYATANTGA